VLLLKLQELQELQELLELLEFQFQWPQSTRRRGTAVIE